MKNLTLYTSASLPGGASNGNGVKISVSPHPASVMLPVEISCSSTTPVVAIQGRLTSAANFVDLTTTAQGNLQLVPRCNEYRVGISGASGGETLTVTLGVM